MYLCLVVSWCVLDCSNNPSQPRFSVVCGWGGLLPKSYPKTTRKLPESYPKVNRKQPKLLAESFPKATHPSPRKPGLAWIIRTIWQFNLRFAQTHQEIPAPAALRDRTSPIYRWGGSGWLTRMFFSGGTERFALLRACFFYFLLHGNRQIH